MAGEHPFPHHATIPVLGVPVGLRSNAREVIEAFEEALGQWRMLEPRADLLSDQRVEGTLLLDGGEEGGGSPPLVRYRNPRPDQLVISTQASVVRTDAARREFTGSITRELLASGQHFRSKVMDASVLSVVTWLDRQPLHASAVVRGGTALLLAGPSGTGKSTLAYAAARGGLSVLSEDIVFVQLKPRLRVWGMPAFLHLPPASRHHFPELESEPVRILPTGKEKLALRVADLGAAPSWPAVERAGICIMERTGGGVASYQPLTARELEAALLRSTEPGFHLFDHARAEVASALAAGGAWRLTVADPPQGNIPILHELLDRVDERLAQ